MGRAMLFAWVGEREGWVNVPEVESVKLRTQSLSGGWSQRLNTLGAREMGLG